MIDKYGPEITKSLQIAGNQLYSKLLWYIKINGIIGLAETVLISIFAVICFYIAHKINKKKNYYTNADPFIMLTFMGAIIAIFIFSMIISAGLIPNISKIIAPEYWIINQIVNKVN